MGIGIAGVSNGLEKLVDIQNYVSATNDDMNLIFVVCYIICFLLQLLLEVYSK